MTMNLETLRVLVSQYKGISTYGLTLLLNMKTFFSVLIFIPKFSTGITF